MEPFPTSQPVKMAAFSVNNTPALGALNLPSFFTLPKLPNILFEWAAIVPLVCHLSSHRRDYKTTGDVALHGYVSFGLFPKLGTLTGLARLLSQGPGFLDQASSRGGATCTVWDIAWGSTFPCANGAASDLIKAHARRRSRTAPRRMPDALPKPATKDAQSLEAGLSTISTQNQGPSLLSDRPSHFRRYQTLHILRCRRSPKAQRMGTVSRSGPLKRLLSVSFAIILLLLAVAIALCGGFGTAALLLCSITSHIAARSTVIIRPPGYLESNEGPMDACMLMAPHQNSQEWTLFVGDRCVIDTMLNKPMMIVPENNKNELAAAWFRIANVLQLLLMTFVAAQKGWDGICLVILLIVESSLRWQWRDSALVKSWMSGSCVTVDTSTFLFGSRMVMLGAIEKFGGRQKTVWMNEIVVPSARRDAWLQCLNGEGFSEGAFEASEVSWIKLSSALSDASAKIMRQTVNAEVV